MATPVTLDRKLLEQPSLTSKGGGRRREVGKSQVLSLTLGGSLIQKLGKHNIKITLSSNPYHRRQDE